MINYTIHMRFFGLKRHTVAINCREDTPDSTKKRLAIEKCILQNVPLEGTDLRGAYLEGMALRGINLRDADLGGANLTKCDLSNTELSGANLNGAWLDRCLLDNTKLTKASLYKTSIDYARIKNSDLTDADLTHANLTRTSINSVVLRNAKLNYANMSGVELKNVDLSTTKSMCKTIADGRYIKSLQVLTLPLLYTDSFLQIGGIRQPHNVWWGLDTNTVQKCVWHWRWDAINGGDANQLADKWGEWKYWLRDLIEIRSPAEPIPVGD